MKLGPGRRPEPLPRQFDEKGRHVPSTKPGQVGRQHSTTWDAPAGSHGGVARDLDVSTSRQSRIGSCSTRGGDRPVPFHKRAGEASSRLRSTLHTWAAYFATEQERLLIDAAGTESLAVWLAGHLPRITVDPSAGQLRQAIADSVKLARHIVDRPADQWYAGTCGNELASGETCRAPLYADPNEAFVECNSHTPDLVGCGTTWKLDERRTYLLHMAEDQLASASVIAQALTALERPMTGERIRKWKERGQLIPKSYEYLARDSTEQDRHPLYRVGDVLDLMARDLERQAKRHAKAAQG